MNNHTFPLRMTPEQSAGIVKVLCIATPAKFLGGIQFRPQRTKISLNLQKSFLNFGHFPTNKKYNKNSTFIIGIKKCIVQNFIEV